MSLELGLGAYARADDDALRLDFHIAFYRETESRSAEVVSCDPSGFSYATAAGW